MKNKIVFLLIVLVPMIVFASTGNDRIDGVFEYDESLMEVGTLYELEGAGGKFYNYIKNNKTIEATNGRYYTTFHFDFKNFIVNKVIQKSLINELYNDYYMINSTKNAILEYDYKKMRLRTEVESWDKNGKIIKSVYSCDIKKLPFYDYATSHLDLTIVMRFLNSNIKNFTVLNVYANKSTDVIIKKIGEENIHGIDCVKWEMKGKGLLAKMFGYNGYIWLANKKPYYLVKYVNNLKVDSREYHFIKKKKISIEEWEEFKKELTKEKYEDYKKNL